MGVVARRVNALILRARPELIQTYARDGGIMNEPDRELPDSATPAARRRSSRWLWLLLAGALVVLYFERIRGHSEVGAEGMGSRHHAVGHRLPDLKFEALTGDSQDVTLKSLAGKVVVINFWATWCGYCVEELPEIAALAVQLRDQPDFRLLLVSCDGEDADLGSLQETTKEFLAQKQYQLPTYADRSGVARQNLAMVLRPAGFSGYPTTIVLGRTGIIRGVWVGYDPGIGNQLKQLDGQLLQDES